MRPWLFLSAVLVTAATPALAQVTVDLHALQALPNRAPSARPPRSPPPATQGAAAATPGASAGAPAALTRVTPSAPAPALATPPPQQPDLPENIPDTAAITPIAPPEPPAGAPPPPPPPISDNAATTAAPTATGLRLTFAPEQSDLSQESSVSIKQFTASSPSGDTTFNVLAYAPGKSDDPSTARRVSLSRAMAVRSALIADGIPSARIFVRALGEQYGNGPPDRVDIGMTGGTPSSSPAATR